MDDRTSISQESNEQQTSPTPIGSPPQLNQPSQPQKNINMKLAVAGLLISIIAIGIFYILLFTNATKSDNTTVITPPVTPAVTPTITQSSYTIPDVNKLTTPKWKTYRHERYAFEFKFPPKVFANDFPESDGTWFGLLPYSSEEQPETEEDLGGGLIVMIQNKSYIDELFDPSALDLQKSAISDYRDEKIEIDRKQGRIISGYIEESNTKVHQRNMYIPIEDKYIYIDYIEKVISKEEFDQILATFKFSTQQPTPVN